MAPARISTGANNPNRDPTGRFAATPNDELIEVFPPGSLPAINPLEHGLFREVVQRIAGEGNCMYE
jgi:hypothetical protein